MKAGAWRWLPVLAYAALIFYLSHQPRWVVTLPTFDGVDKLLHFLEYGVFTALVIFALGPRGAEARLLFLAAGAIVLFAISDEVHQAFVPGRSADPLDALADALGVAAVIAVHFAWSRARARNA